MNVRRKKNSNSKIKTLDPEPSSPFNDASIEEPTNYLINIRQYITTTS